ncbi:MAG: type IV toxin-antitoxin system AbiEi family antitoxin domain-containing protein [Chloroflexota bacterium]
MSEPLFPQLLERALDQHGLLTPEDAQAIGANDAALRLMAHRGTLERVGFGIYRVPQLAGDRLAQYQDALLRVRNDAALSHETALDLHDLCDINPAQVHVTVAPGIRLRRRLPGWLVVHRGHLDPHDLAWHEGLRIATPVRAILDGIAIHVGDRFIDQAVETGRDRGLLGPADLRRIEIARAKARLAALEAL